MLEQELKKSLERAIKYFDIVNSIGKEGISKDDQYNWLTRNTSLLVKEMRKFGYNTKTISRFPTLLKSELSPRLRVKIVSTVQTSINGYIQEIEELIQNPNKLKEFFKYKKERKNEIIEFDRGKIIEILVLGFYITSLFLILNNELFIYGFSLNLISVIALIIVSFIKWGERQE